MKSLLKAIEFEAERLEASSFREENDLGRSLRNILKLEKRITTQTARQEKRLHSECLDAAYGSGGQG